jgi:two-component system, NtrC family, nitrogen regulation sensor histidine kinase NtrY
MESDPTPDNGSDSAPHPRLRSNKHPDRDTPFERRIRTLCVFIAAPAFILAAILLWRAKVSGTMATVLLGVVALLSLLAAGVLMEEIIRPLQTLANVVSALRESDYSFRAPESASR